MYFTVGIAGGDCVFQQQFSAFAPQEPKPEDSRV